jgi:hypothetical protein
MLSFPVYPGPEPRPPLSPFVPDARIAPQRTPQRLRQCSPVPAGSRPFDSRHRDENLVTVNPLDSALTKRDANNSFRMRSYENYRGWQPNFRRSLKSYFNFSSNFPRILRQSPLFSSFPFNNLRTLSFSVSRNSRICHSYENTRGVYQLFPVWKKTPPACAESQEDDIV